MSETANLATRDAKSATGFDVIVIGAGHNGLVAACYMQRAGLNVAVVEKNDWIGGAAVSRELHPGIHLFQLLLCLQPVPARDHARSGIAATRPASHRL